MTRHHFGRRNHRDEELLERSDTLDALGGGLQAAGGRVVLLGGDAGLGKTALIRRFVSASTPRVLVGAADDLLTAIPLGPIAEMSRQGGRAFEVEMAAGETRDRA
ncbi:MAG: hypothetical protein OEM97_00455 [Acidimicrobiia bacterium]|nr:hypothetical protein [Acidimicrobiia bacterium]